MNKNIIVTGGMGFIGSNLVNLLLKKNFKVSNIDKITYSSNSYNTKDFEKNKNYRFIKSDIYYNFKIILIPFIIFLLLYFSFNLILKKNLGSKI